MPCWAFFGRAFLFFQTRLSQKHVHRHFPISLLKTTLMKSEEKQMGKPSPLVGIIYKLANGKRICLNVTIEVKELLEQSDRQIRTQRRQDKRHLDYVESMDELDTLPLQPQADIADLVIMMDSHSRLYSAMDKLSDVIRRRVYLYHFCGLSCREIADMEKVHHTTVSRSLQKALKILKRHLAE